MNIEKLRAFAPDLNRVAPRSPYAALDEFPVWAHDRSTSAAQSSSGRAGSYRFNCPMDRRFFEEAGLSAEPLRNFVATGADDKEVAGWIAAQAKAPTKDFLRWCRRFQANPLWRLLELEDWLHRRRSARKAKLSAVMS